jgi:ribosome-binding factor A
MSTSDRVPQLNELIRHELARIITREIEFPVGTLATITRVETRSDLTEATVWMSFQPEEASQALSKIIRSRAGRLQWLLNRALSMSSVPKICFKRDPNPLGQESDDEIDKLFREIKSE